MVGRRLTLSYHEKHVEFVQLYRDSKNVKVMQQIHFWNAHFKAWWQIYHVVGLFPLLKALETLFKLQGSRNPWRFETKVKILKIFLQYVHSIKIINEKHSLHCSLHSQKSNYCCIALVLLRIV